MRQPRRSFAGLAASYSSHDFLVREIDRRMQERLDFVRLTPSRIIDLGCSCGGSLAGLLQRYPEAEMLGVDREIAMLKAADLPVAVAEAACLPLASDSVSLVWSNLLLHWLADPRQVFAEARRVLATGGLFMFSTLGPDTLKELRAAFPDRHAHTQLFTDMHDLGDQLLACGFADPVMDREDITLTYDSFAVLLGELRQGSASCLVNGRRRGLTAPAFWRQVEADYAQIDGKWPVTFEVVYGHAWRLPATSAADGESILRFYR